LHYCIFVTEQINNDNDDDQLNSIQLNFIVTYLQLNSWTADDD